MTLYVVISLTVSFAVICMIAFQDYNIREQIKFEDEVKQCKKDKEKRLRKQRRVG